MTRSMTDRIAACVAASGLLAAAAAWGLGGREVGGGAVAGAVVATVNWLVLRHLVSRATARGRRGGAGALVAILVGKTVALFAVCGALVLAFGVDAIGLAVGLSALPVGLLVGVATAGAAAGGAAVGPAAPTGPAER